jgi:hypothetical protein
LSLSVCLLKKFTSHPVSYSPRCSQKVTVKQTACCYQRGTPIPVSCLLCCFFALALFHFRR